jgi:hypothetical protein
MVGRRAGEKEGKCAEWFCVLGSGASGSRGKFQCSACIARACTVCPRANEACCFRCHCCHRNCRPPQTRQRFRALFHRKFARFGGSRDSQPPSPLGIGRPRCRSGSNSHCWEGSTRGRSTRLRRRICDSSHLRRPGRGDVMANYRSYDRGSSGDGISHVQWHHLSSPAASAPPLWAANKASSHSAEATACPTTHGCGPKGAKGRRPRCREGTANDSWATLAPSSPPERTGGLSPAGGPAG